MKSKPKHDTRSQNRSKQPTQKQAANTSRRFSEEGITNPTGNTKQATSTPFKLLLILQSSLIIKQDKYTDANVIEEKKDEKEKGID